MLCTYENIGNCHVKQNLPLSDWLNQIRYSPDYSDTIEAARADGKIDDLKLVLPCITYNFLFNKYKNDKNIISGTGYMYIDIDKPGFDINTIDKDKIYAYYRSIRLKGYGVLVRVDGLTLSNFQVTYEAVIDDLGLSGRYDTQARKATQFSVLSYDPDIFINEDSKVYQAAYVAEPINNVLTPSLKIETGIRFDNIDEIPIPEGKDFVVNWKGFDVVRCFLPFNKSSKTVKKLSDGRKRFILSYCTNLIWLNPKMSFDIALNRLKNVNEIACVIPLDIPRLQGTLTCVLKQLHAGELTPIVYNKKRKIVFKRGLKWSWEEKMIVVNNEQSKRWLALGNDKINSILDNWDFDTYGKISQRKIAKYGKMCNNTVTKYIKSFSSRIEEMNNTYKSKNVLTPSLKKKKKTYSEGISTLLKSESMKQETQPAVKDLKKQMKLNIDVFNALPERTTAAKKTLLDSIYLKTKEIERIDASINAHDLFRNVVNYIDRIPS